MPQQDSERGPVVILESGEARQRKTPGGNPWTERCGGQNGGEM